MGEDRSHTNAKRVGLAFVYCYDLDAKELHLLIDACHVFHVTGKAVQGLHNDDFKSARPSILEHLLDAIATMKRGTGFGLVMVGFDDLETFALGKRLA
ncbi:hypothetical protein LJR104_002768 [Neorhizobium sp. LjRoot104]